MPGIASQAAFKKYLTGLAPFAQFYNPLCVTKIEAQPEHEQTPVSIAGTFTGPFIDRTPQIGEFAIFVAQYESFSEWWAWNPVWLLKGNTKESNHV